MAKTKEKREALSEMGIYLLPALSKDDAIKENLILKKRRDTLKTERNSDKNWKSERSKCSTMESQWIKIINLMLRRENDYSNWKFYYWTRNVSLTVNASSNRQTQSWPNLFMFCVFLEHCWAKKFKFPNTSWEIINFTEPSPRETDVSLHGSLLIAVKISLDFQKLDNVLHDCCIFCNIKLAKSDIIKCVFYKSPNDHNYSYKKRLWSYCERLFQNQTTPDMRWC